MSQKIWDYFEMAGKIAVSKEDRRSYLLGAIAIRGDGAIVAALNGPSQFPAREAHAEFRLARKLDVGAVVYIARVKVGDGTFGNAKPCSSCRKILKAKGVNKVFYTLGPKEFGVLYF